MNLNEEKYGFKLVDIKDINDINVKMYRYSHIKSNATVIHFDCDDVNKAFAIGFKTVPTDSTGVCHILEHSVLCGSKKYPLKEPFVNLLKTSLATFLNAFTSSDWTMYPFASANNKDFDNILGIYTDAVFNPLVIEDKKAFLQEGWHLELFNKNDMPSYKGVVYNEMKGAMSSVGRILNEATKSEFFKDSTYHYNSGGDPDVIPTLTYEQYKEFYHKHYTPENALTFFYGDLDIEEKLKFLDENYFSNYTKTNNEIVIPEQKPLISTNKIVEYVINDDEDEKNNSYIGLCYSLGDYSSFEEYLALTILFDALLSSNDSPITKELLDHNLGEDVSYMVDDSCNIPTLNISLQKTDKDKKDQFIKVFLDKVKDLVNNGIDKKLLLAKINRSEFLDKEQDNGSFPKGIGYAMNLMSAFNYHLPYESRFEFNKAYQHMKEELDHNYFEGLLEKYILNSNHYVCVTAVPSKTLATLNKVKMENKMKEIKESMTDKEIDDLIEMNEELLKYQSHKDSNEELKCLPTLKIKDLSKDVYDLNTHKIKINGIKGIYHKVNTNHISYLKMYFNMNKIKFEDLKYTYLLHELLLDVPTKNYSAIELNNLIETYLGSFNPGESLINESKDKYQFYFKFEASALDENVSYIPVVFNEIFTSKFPKNKVKQVLTQSVNKMKRGLPNMGNKIAMVEALSMYSASYTIERNAYPSVKLYKDLKELLDNFNYTEINKKLKEICAKLFNKKNAIISISGDENSLELLKNVSKNIKLPRKEYNDELVPVLNEKKNIAVIVPSQVNYNAIASNYEDLCEANIGNLTVLASIINYDYLWNEVRVKGGAYGCNIGQNASHDCYFTSYRDPNVNSTYDAYYNVLDYIDNMKINKSQLESYIIGSCSGFEKPLSTPMLIAVTDLNYFRGYGKKERLERKKSIIKTKKEDLIACRTVLENVLNNSSRVTIGNKDKIDEQYFDEVISL